MPTKRTTRKSRVKKRSGTKRQRGGLFGWGKTEQSRGKTMQYGTLPGFKSKPVLNNQARANQEAHKKHRECVEVAADKCWKGVLANVKRKQNEWNARYGSQ